MWVLQLYVKREGKHGNLTGEGWAKRILSLGKNNLIQKYLRVVRLVRLWYIRRGCAHLSGMFTRAKQAQHASLTPYWW